jgi:hypothetical protein
VPRIVAGCQLQVPGVGRFDTKNLFIEKSSVPGVPKMAQKRGGD